MQEFRAQHKKGTVDGELYARLNRNDAATFRAQWAAKQYEQFKREKLYTTSWSKVDFTKGRYRTLGAIVKDDGGWEDAAAVRGAVTLAQQCSLLGEPWTKYNFQKKRMMFLELDWSFEEAFKEAWSEATTHFGATETPRANAKHAATPPRAKAKAKALEDDPDNDPKRDDDATSGASKLTALIRNATKYKNEFLAITSKASLIEKQIETEQAWDWANNAQNGGQLTTLIAAASSALTLFQKRFLSENVGTLKKNVEKEVMIAELSDLLGKRATLDRLDDCVKSLVRKHASRVLGARACSAWAEGSLAGQHRQSLAMSAHDVRPITQFLSVAFRIAKLLPGPHNPPILVLKLPLQFKY